MPPTVRVTQGDILAAALNIVRESGTACLNARSVARKLNCSTQPIFSNYATMEDLKSAVLDAAKQLYHQYLEKGMKDPTVPPYKASGMAYIRFAKEEKELFKLLFMRDRSQEDQNEKKEDIAGLIHLISSNTGMSTDDAYLFHLEMWIYVHGIATMIATAFLNWEWKFISNLLTNAYQGMITRYKSKEKNK